MPRSTHNQLMNTITLSWENWRAVIRFLRETSPMYIYSNPITAGEATTAAP